MRFLSSFEGSKWTQMRRPDSGSAFHVRLAHCRYALKLAREFHAASAASARGFSAKHTGQLQFELGCGHEPCRFGRRAGAPPRDVRPADGSRNRITPTRRSLV